MKRIVALDIGDKTVGIAVSDPFNSYALPSQTYFRTKNLQQDILNIVKIIKEKSASTVVCGMPVNFDGSESIQTIKTRKFIESLKEAIDIEIVLEDERFTTMQAESVLIEGGVKRENRKQSIDSIAAAYILDGYLTKYKRSNKNE